MSLSGCMFALTPDSRARCQHPTITFESHTKNKKSGRPPRKKDFDQVEHDVNPYSSLILDL
jgi:hypothetical protein